MIVRLVHWFIIIIFVFSLCGCRKGPSKTSDTSKERVRYNKLVNGSKELTEALALLTKAVDAQADLKSLLPKSGEIRDAEADAKDYMDSCGDTISDFVDEPDAYDKYKADVKRLDTDLSDSIEASCDAYQDLGEAISIVESVIDAAPAKLKTKLATWLDAMVAAQDQIGTAIVAFGGQVPDFQATDDGGGGEDEPTSEESTNKSSESSK